MKILSNNFNGKVLKTSNGFSVSKSLKKLEKLCKDMNFSFDFEKAKTGTVYVTISTELYEIWIRLSNHTKRNEQMIDVEYINNKIIKWLEGGKDPTETYQAINQNTFDIVFEKLNTLK